LVAADNARNSWKFATHGIFFFSVASSGAAAARTQRHLEPHEVHV
jgi:hypothetical protein